MQPLSSNPNKKFPPVSILEVFRVMFRAMRPEIFGLALTIGSVIIANAISIIIPVFYKSFFDLLIGSSDKSATAPALVHVIFIVLGLNIISWIGYRITAFTNSRFQARTMARLKQDAFDSMIGHSQSFFANSFTGALVQRVNRLANGFERLADRIVFDITALTVQITGIAIVVWYVNPFFSLLILLWVAIFLAFNYFFSVWKLKYDLKRSETDSHTTAVLADAITNQNAIQLFNGQRSESRNLKDATNAQARITEFTWNLDSIASTVQSTLLIAMEFGVFYFAIQSWTVGLFSAGSFVLLQIYVLSLGDKVFNFSRVVRDLYQSYADAEEMAEIMKLPKEIQDAPNAKKLQVIEGKIEFKDTSFSFNETRTILKDINVTLHPGEKIALIGPSGAGKSTFIKLLLRYYDTEIGSILIDGQDIKEVTMESLYANLSLVPQDPVLFHRSLLENIRYGRPEATDAEVFEAARLAHCDEFIKDLPQKYDTFVGERGIKLSGGERQRVAIARAILRNAPILILDEATSSLDSHSESLIQEALEVLMKGKTTIVIAHRLSTIRRMDRIIVIENGQIIEEGSHDKLVEKADGLYKKLWTLQAGGFLAE